MFLYKFAIFFLWKSIKKQNSGTLVNRKLFGRTSHDSFSSQIYEKGQVTEAFVCCYIYNQKLPWRLLLDRCAIKRFIIVLPNEFASAGFLKVCFLIDLRPKASVTFVSWQIFFQLWDSEASIENSWFGESSKNCSYSSTTNFGLSFLTFKGLRFLRASIVQKLPCPLLLHGFAMRNCRDLCVRRTCY